METEKKLNVFVWIGFALDLIGFAIAMFLSFVLGIVIMVVGLAFSIVGLVLCITKKGNVLTAALYVVLDLGFLVWILFFL